MSTCSNGSQISVSYYGEEKDFDEMCDVCFKSLQSYMNDLHCKIRELSMIDEQDADYLQALDCYHELQGGIDGITDLLKELSSVSKQVLGPCPKNLKKDAAAKIAEYKLKKAQDKELEKMQKLAMSSIEEKE